MISEASFNRGSDSQGLMDTAEIVVSEVQRDGGFQVSQFLAKSIRQARESANRHSHGKVLPFHVTGRDVSWIKIASSDSGYNLHDWTWGVPRIGVGLAPLAKQFHELREVKVQAEGIRNASGVMMQAVSRDLRAARGSPVQVPQQGSRIFAMSLANVEGRNQFRLGINRRKNPLVANFR